MSISRLRAFALVLVGLAVIPATVACTGGDAAETPTGGGGFMGAVVTPPIEKPHAILTDEYGQPFNLRKETEGYVTLLFVGFTHCPDICPRRPRQRRRRQRPRRRSPRAARGRAAR